ncbi:MAG: ATP-binding cassette domain-containing protein [Bifidobacteriaceae bacterium]|jgi:teichoic acid transport system ATP-binding protein|nr:ATP-binding cassette domain-containing protein [Bifidobacteriaceae bacterium]
MAENKEIDFSADVSVLFDRSGSAATTGSTSQTPPSSPTQPSDATPPGADEPTTRSGRSLGDPTMIVDQVHVRYRVFGARRIGTANRRRPSLYKRLTDRTNRSVGTVSEVHAVRGVSFVAHQGESIGIIGRNGAGKTTLLRAIAGLMPYSEGAVYAKGQCSLLGVNAALLPRLTGERNIMLGALALGLTPAQVRERFDDIVDFSGIGEFVSFPMNAYSSGMASRLRFAISTARVPDILMIDEALSTGDAEFQMRSREKSWKSKSKLAQCF